MLWEFGLLFRALFAVGTGGAAVALLCSERFDKAVVLGLGFCAAASAGIFLAATASVEGPDVYTNALVAVFLAAAASCSALWALSGGSKRAVLPFAVMCLLVELSASIHVSYAADVYWGSVPVSWSFGYVLVLAFGSMAFLGIPILRCTMNGMRCEDWASFGLSFAVLGFLALVAAGVFGYGYGARGWLEVFGMYICASEIGAALVVVGMCCTAEDCDDAGSFYVLLEGIAGAAALTMFVRCYALAVAVLVACGFVLMRMGKGGYAVALVGAASACALYAVVFDGSSMALSSWLAPGKSLFDEGYQIVSGRADWVFGQMHPFGGGFGLDDRLLGDYAMAPAAICLRFGVTGMVSVLLAMGALLVSLGRECIDLGGQEEAGNAGRRRTFLQMFYDLVIDVDDFEEWEDDDVFEDDACECAHAIVPSGMLLWSVGSYLVCRTAIAFMGCLGLIPIMDVLPFAGMAAMPAGVVMVLAVFVLAEPRSV
ncbi:hypothetical protein [Slackia heliotrinireducens]|uniref:hypothetical protein n=1 Tax=Slackia heliotrinireducens TaxID=84110 RepID=UPI003314D90A